MMIVEREIRAIPLWLLCEYLEQLGGRVASDGWLYGAGWAARLTQIDDYQIGSLRVGQVRLAVRGDAEAVARLQAALEPQLQRAGG